MPSRWVSLLIWALVVASAVAWALRLGGRATPVPAQAVTALPSAAQGGDFSRVFGQPPVVAVAANEPVLADSRFKLVGVVAPRGERRGGLALISVDGKPARALRVGREVEPGLTLVAVNHRGAELGRAGAPSMLLELPALPEAQRGRPGDLAVPAAAFGVPAAARPPGMPMISGFPAQPGGAVPPRRPAFAQPGVPTPSPPQPVPGAVTAEPAEEPPTAGRLSTR